MPSSHNNPEIQQIRNKQVSLQYSFYVSSRINSAAVLVSDMSETERVLSPSDVVLSFTIEVNSLCPSLNPFYICLQIMSHNLLLS